MNADGSAPPPRYVHMISCTARGFMYCACPRCDHSAFVVGGKMVTTAGSGSDDLWFNDVYTLDISGDISSWHWTKVYPKGSVRPSPRDYTSVSVVADKVG